MNLRFVKVKINGNNWGGKFIFVKKCNLKFFLFLFKYINFVFFI